MRYYEICERAPLFTDRQINSMALALKSGVSIGDVAKRFRSSSATITKYLIMKGHDPEKMQTAKALPGSEFMSGGDTSFGHHDPNKWDVLGRRNASAQQKILSRKAA